MPESEVQRFLGGEASLLSRWRVDKARVSRYTAEEILEFAVKGNVLIRGWGATYLLRNVPHVVCVRICAPMVDRERVLDEWRSLAIHQKGDRITCDLGTRTVSGAWAGVDEHGFVFFTNYESAKAGDLPSWIRSTCRGLRSDGNYARPRSATGLRGWRSSEPPHSARLGGAPR
jgi:hypothetical protein